MPTEPRGSSALLPFALPPYEPLLLDEVDHQQACDLLQLSRRQHIHLDWQSLPNLLADPLTRCWLVKQDKNIQALVGATLHRPAQTDSKVAWLRLILPSASDALLDHAWEALQADLTESGIEQVGLLAVDSWVERLATRWHFGRTNSVVTLERPSGTTPPRVTPPLRIRDVGPADLAAIEQVDAAAFHPLWHHNRAALEAAHPQSATFTVIELQGSILGYQLSTWYIDTGHLARLAVKPEAQGRGLGKLLVGEMLRFFEERGITRITVNTQEDNLVSQKLYTSLGFHFTGHSVPVWTLKIG
jgi:ribosomal protein S18 acetylase RimI-like enzyme